MDSLLGLLEFGALMFLPVVLGITGLYGTWYFGKKTFSPGIDLTSRIGNGIFFALALGFIGLIAYTFLFNMG